MGSIFVRSVLLYREQAESCASVRSCCLGSILWPYFCIQQLLSFQFVPPARSTTLCVCTCTRSAACSVYYVERLVLFSHQRDNDWLLHSP